jgi:transcriptional regulator with XRE-family HTH domain
MKSETRNKIAEIVKEWVDKSKFTQSQLADMIGISQAAFNAQLNAKRPITPERLRFLADKLNPPPDDMEYVRMLLVTNDIPEEKFMTEANIKEYAKLKNAWTEKLLDRLEMESQKRLFLLRLVMWVHIDMTGERYLKLLNLFSRDIDKCLGHNHISLGNDVTEVILKHPLLQSEDSKRLYDEATKLVKIAKKWEHFELINTGVAKAICEKVSDLTEDEQEKILLHILELKIKS